MAMRSWFHPALCFLILVATTLACELPLVEEKTNSAATQTMEALATIVASTLDTLSVTEIPPPTVDQATELVPPTETLSLGSIEGRVWHDLNQDGVMDEDEPPMPGTAILLGEGPCESVGYMSVSTEADGTFSFGELPEGTYCVVVFLPHGCGGFTPTVEHPRTVTVTSGVDQEELFLGVVENPCS
jgi:hypothetical protein